MTQADENFIKTCEERTKNVDISIEIKCGMH